MQGMNNYADFKGYENGVDDVVVKAPNLVFKDSFINETFMNKYQVPSNVVREAWEHFACDDMLGAKLGSQEHWVELPFQVRHQRSTIPPE